MGRSVRIETGVARRVKALSANTNATSFASLAELTAAPSASGTHKVSGANSILVWPFGTDNANESFDMKIVLWWRGNDSWGYSVGFLGLCTLGTATGVANGDVVAADFYCDTIAYSSGLAPYSIGSATANTPALLRMDTLGAEYVQFDFNNDASGTDSATANAIFARI